MFSTILPLNKRNYSRLKMLLVELLKEIWHTLGLERVVRDLFDPMSGLRSLTQLLF